jgi:hypothetical protein
MTFDHVYAALVGGIVVLWLVYLGVGVGIGLTVLIVYRRDVSRWLPGTGTAGGEQRIPPQADFTLSLVDGDGVPIRQHRLTARGIAHVITELNANPGLYR